MARIIKWLMLMLVGMAGTLLSQDFREYDSTMRALYWRGDYERLAQHTLANEKQHPHPYYFRGLYTGVALYQLGHFRQSLRYLTEARHRNDNDTVRGAMAAAMLALGRPEDARALSPRTTYKGKWLESVMAAGGYRTNTDDSIHTPTSSGIVRAEGSYRQLYWTQTLQYYHLGITVGPTDTLPVTQGQHYVRLSLRPSYGFSASVAWHTLYAVIDTLKEWSYLGYADWLWHGRYGYLGPSVTTGKVNRATIWQGAVQGQWLPLGSNSLYLRGQLAWQQTDSTGTAIAEATAGTKVVSWLWVEGNVLWPFYGNRLSEYQGVYYYLGNRGEYVYNAGDPTTWKVSLTAAFLLSSRLKLILAAQTEERFFIPYNSAYFQNGLNLGLSWKF